ncbi:MAG: acyltransferase family protein [Acidimicrobiales bacterium]
MSATRTPTATSPTRLADLAAAAKSDRNRAVDFFRAVAMIAVAIGHWMAIAVSADAEGNVSAGNALVDAPNMAWFSWALQVMPLFFVVGGFSSAMSLDAHTNRHGRPQDWVAARLRRMLAPTVVLAGFWLGALTIGTALGFGSYAAQGAVAAAIPLWFLANYTIDTAIAPVVLPAFRHNPRLVAGGGVALFCALEALRLVGVPVIPHLNWVLGWLLFQVAGFAWRDGLLPTGRRLVALAAGAWAAALTVVLAGPYPVSMVNVEGLEHSPANPPTLALLLFGTAHAATALCFAPMINRWLADNAKAWAAVVAANTVAMSVYLWHMTAAVVAGVALLALDLLPTAAVGASAWWLQKLPLIAAAAVVLAGLVAAVARFEQGALLAERQPWRGGVVSMTAVAALTSAALKLWVAGSPVAVAVACAGVVALWFGAIHRPAGRTTVSASLEG